MFEVSLARHNVEKHKMKNVQAIWGSFLGAVALLVSTQPAWADNTGTTVVREETQTTGPNRAFLHSGLWVFGLAYVPAVIVAAESSRHGDKSLYVPVAGPWIDLGSRGGCLAGSSCNNETVNKVLLVVDGIFQGLGALDFVGAFVFPETRTVTTSSSAFPSVRFLPAHIGTAYGVAALGRF